MISIDQTETVEPTEEASVLDDFENNIHQLTFYIPKGVKGDIGNEGPIGPVGPPGEKGETGSQELQGPTGPKGDPNGIAAYGERYSMGTQRFSVTADRETIIPLETTGLAFFTDFDSTYAISIKKFGSYYISVKASGTKLPASVIKGEGKANSRSNATGTLIFGLAEGDEVTLVLKADQNAEFIFDEGINAKLSVIKLD